MSLTLNREQENVLRDMIERHVLALRALIDCDPMEAQTHLEASIDATTDLMREIGMTIEVSDTRLSEDFIEMDGETAHQYAVCRDPATDMG